VGGLELFGQLVGAGLDHGAARRPAGEQFWLQTDDFAHRAFTAPGGFGGRERHPEPVSEVGFQAAVVQLGGRDGDPVERGAVQRQPPAVGGADLVGDRDVGVQVGVTGAGVAVGERRGDQPGGVDLGDAVGAGAGERCFLLKEFQRVGDGGVVAFLDGFGHRAGCDRPQRRHAFHWGEGQVGS
jgi:hypothetical protein